MTIRIEPRKTLALRLTPRIIALQLSREYREPLQSPSCEPDDPRGMVIRSFHYKGKGRDEVIQVRAHAKAMVGLMKAMRRAPTIQITQSSTNKYSGSYRSYAQQKLLYDEYKAGIGNLAAHPCSGYHRQGRAFDLYKKTSAEHAAMLAVRVDGLKFESGVGFGDPPHFTLGAYG